MLFSGVTGDLKRRLYEHQFENTNLNSFTSKFKVHYLIYYESFNSLVEAIDREAAIKKWTRKKKLETIRRFNPKLSFLNDNI